jgi:hypothetical protein
MISNAHKTEYNLPKVIYKGIHHWEFNAVFYHFSSRTLCSKYAMYSPSYEFLSLHLLFLIPKMYFPPSDSEQLFIFKTQLKCHLPSVGFSEHTRRIYHSCRTCSYIHYTTSYFFNYLFISLLTLH